MPSIDAVIPVKNGMPEIRDCIDGILSQRLAVGRIIVLDSGSTDGTLEYLSHIPQVTVVPVEPSTFNHGQTRNIGWQTSDAEFLFYTVQDARALSSGMLEDMLSGFSEPTVAGVCGRQVVCQSPKHNPVEWHRPIDPPQERRYRVTDAAAFDDMPPAARKEMAAWDNVAAMYRRSELQGTPFREVKFGEDMYWAMDVLRKGRTLVHRPTASVCHYHLEDREGTFRRAMSSMYYNHRILGYTYPRPEMTARRIVSIVRLCLMAGGMSLAERFRWLAYNFQRHKDLSDAWRLFDHALQSGDAALHSIFSTWVERPPVPLKKD